MEVWDQLFADIASFLNVTSVREGSASRGRNDDVIEETIRKCDLYVRVLRAITEHISDSRSHRLGDIGQVIDRLTDVLLEVRRNWNELLHNR